LIVIQRSSQRLQLKLTKKQPHPNNTRNESKIIPGERIWGVERRERERVVLSPTMR
jgi:hypothetical protein